MQLDKKLKPELAVSDDETRYVLTKLNVRESHPKLKGPAIEATNGSMLVAVPCELDKDDVPGMLDVVPLQRGREASRYRSVPLALGKDRVTDRDGVIYPRKEDGKYPETDTVIPKGEEVLTVRVNAELLVCLQRAMGANQGVKLTFRKPNVEDDTGLNAIEVTPPETGEGQGYGIIMPLRI